MFVASRDLPREPPSFTPFRDRWGSTKRVGELSRGEHVSTLSSNNDSCGSKGFAPRKATRKVNTVVLEKLLNWWASKQLHKAALNLERPQKYAHSKRQYRYVSLRADWSSPHFSGQYQWPHFSPRHKPRSLQAARAMGAAR